MEKELLLAIREMLKEELNPLKNEIKDIKSEMTDMKNRMDETYEIVKALEHSSKVNKAEHDHMLNDIAHIKGNVEIIKKDMYRVEEATANNWADIARLKQVK
ncbi:hypothetical protein [Crassaminicella profunda]|uniref:hypothetical protein n=1 Tax=Crassaminicella profunda TaxID=1286698 RepID=UPI001CA69EBB|nr:hypothetical protein [Crassaminicella profunda]QZY55345.1 hypothetical protein K7H06_20500 [Crassaminicella profunda]